MRPSVQAVSSSRSLSRRCVSAEKEVSGSMWRVVRRSCGAREIEPRLREQHRGRTLRRS